MTEALFWKRIKLQNNDKHFAVRSRVYDQLYEFQITDYQRLWSERIPLKGMNSRFESQNPGMEIEEKELFSFIDEAISNSETQFSEVVLEETNKIKLSMTFKSFGLNMIWSFTCVEGHQGASCCDITDSILQSVSYLIHERETLMKTTNEGRKFDRKKFEESTLMKFDNLTRDTQLKNIYTEFYQNILNHFGRQFNEHQVPVSLQDEQIATRTDGDQDIQNSVKSEEEEEMERRMELKRKLERDATKAKKKVLKF